MFYLIVVIFMECFYRQLNLRKYFQYSSHLLKNEQIYGKTTFSASSVAVGLILLVNARYRMASVYDHHVTASVWMRHSCDVNGENTIIGMSLIFLKGS